MPGKGCGYSGLSCVEPVKLCWDVDGTAVRNLLLFMHNSILGSDSRNSCIDIKGHSYSKKMGQER